MPVTFTCPKCNTLLRVSRKKIGETVGCPKCDTLMIVPELVEESAPQEEPVSVGASTERAEVSAPAAEPSARPVTSKPLPEREVSAKALLQEGAGVKAPSTPAAKASAPAPQAPATSAPTSASAPASAPQQAPSTLADDGEEEYDDEELISEFIVYDDSASHLPNVTAEGAAKSEASATTTPTTPAAAATPTAAAPEPPLAASAFQVPPGMVLVPRMALLIVTLLFMGVTVGAYLVGYMLGQGDAPQAEVEGPTGPSHSVIVEGRMTYITPAGSVAGDSGAVLLALPQGAEPDPKLPHVGLRPEDVAHLGVSPEIMAMVKKAGGNVVQTDRDGAFLFTVPKPGKYFLLGLSRRAERADGRAVNADDLAIFARFFVNPEVLLGKKKHLLKLETLDRVGALQVLSFGQADE